MASRFKKPVGATARARRLRRDATEVEKTLWRHLRAAQIGGVSFRRQHPVGTHIVDFCAPSLKLIVELDGGQHGNEADAARTAWLERAGFEVLRFWNAEVTENFDGVVEAILAAVERKKKSGVG